MAVEHEYTSPVLQGNATEEAPFSASLSIPAGGTRRALLVVFMSSLNGGVGGTGSPDDIVVTYGGAQTHVRALAITEGNPITFGIATLYLDTAELEGSELVIDIGAANTVQVTAQAFVFNTTQSGDVDGSYAFLIDGSEESRTIELSPSVQLAEGELIFSFAVKKSLQAGLAFDAEPDADVYTRVAESGVGDFRASNFCDGAAGRIAYSVTAEGQQIVEWEQGSTTSIGALVIVIRSCERSFNCECEEDPKARTLGDMRTEIIRRLGYSAQAQNPPPGMAELVDSFLRSAQEYLHGKYRALNTERIFTWRLEPGIRYYGLAKNNDCCSDAALDPHKVTWVGVEDVHGQWYELIEGIPPSFYTHSENWRGWPERYEIRECIEIFPAPAADVRRLRIKGHFGLRPFTSSEHKTTIDPEAVFLWALGLAKLQYRQPDAGDPARLTGYFGMAIDRVGDLIAGSHHTHRYIPRRRDIPPLPRPRFLPLEE